MLKADRSERKRPFLHFAERWANSYETHLKPSSASRVRLCIKQLSRHFGKMPIAEIGEQDCEAWANSRGRGIAASTFNKESEVLKAVFDYAIQAGILLANPAQRIRRRKPAKKEVIIPSHDGFHLLVTTLQGQDARAQEAVKLIKLLAFSGMRLTEATEITWRDIDFERGSFLVTGGDIGTKNHEPRTVPLFPRLRIYLDELKQERNAQPTDRLMRIVTARTAISNACENANLPHFTHHCLRHYFVSNAIEKGIDFKTIAAWVGHKDGGLLVAQTYGHLRDTHSFEMAKRMA